MPMSHEARDAFLDQPRYAVITTLTVEGRPVSVPVWYEWDGSSMIMFTTIFLERTDMDFLRSDIVSTLTSITGKDFGDNPAIWRQWWTDNRQRP